MGMKRIIAMSTVLALSLQLIGCATPVKPWQKGNLAKSEMGFNPDQLQARFEEHAYHSKEGASGGLSVGGGGCGCN
jgi:hypothetical protein